MGDLRWFIDDPRKNTSRGGKRVFWRVSLYSSILAAVGKLHTNASLFGRDGKQARDPPGSSALISPLFYLRIHLVDNWPPFLHKSCLPRLFFSFFVSLRCARKSRRYGDVSTFKKEIEMGSFSEGTVRNDIGDIRFVTISFNQLLCQYNRHFFTSWEKFCVLSIYEHISFIIRCR
jgi:hypothetical protein